MKISFLLLLLSASLISAQNVPDSLKNKWLPKGVAGINVSQVAFNDWAQGGDNSITWILNSELGLSYYTSSYSLLNKLKLAYGRTKLGGETYRTNDNEIYLENMISYFVGWAVEPYISNTVRTTVSAGYDYKADPAVQTADFFDPGYVTQSIGFAYSKNKNITTRLGLGFQETITNKFRKYSDDPKTADKTEAFKFDTGLETVTDASITLDDNLLYTSRLRLFSRFSSLDVWDVLWDNTIVAKVNSYINVKLNIISMYEKSLSTRTQLKEALLLGFTYTLF